MLLYICTTGGRAGSRMGGVKANSITSQDWKGNYESWERSINSECEMQIFNYMNSLC